MARITIAFGAAMIVIGVIAYFATGGASYTALIPSLVGLLIAICGGVALRPAAARPALVVAGVLAALGVLGPLGRIIPAATRGELAWGAAIVAQLVFMIVSAVLAVLIFTRLPKRTAP